MDDWAVDEFNEYATKKRTSIFEQSLNSLQLFLKCEKENKPTKVFLAGAFSSLQINFICLFTISMDIK